MKKIIGITFLVLITDQLSKIYIKTHYQLGEVTDVFSWFKLAFVENPGMAYGIQFGGVLGKYFLSMVRITLVISMVFLFKKWLQEKRSNFLILPMALIFAGAIGNLIDGMFYGILFDTGTSFDASLGHWVGYEGISKFSNIGYSCFMNGCVVDMLYFPLFSFNWPEVFPIIGGQHFEFFKPVFNIADSSICIGGLFLILFRKKSFPNGIDF